MYNRYIASLNPKIGDVSDIQKHIDSLVVKEVGRAVSTLEDVFFFLQSLEDKKLFDLAIFTEEDLTEYNLNLAVYILTYEIIGNEKEHRKFFYETLPSIIFCIIYERRYRVPIVSINDMHEFTFCFEKIDSNVIGGTDISPLYDFISSFFKTNPE